MINGISVNCSISVLIMMRVTGSVMPALSLARVPQADYGVHEADAKQYDIRRTAYQRRARRTSSTRQSGPQPRKTASPSTAAAVGLQQAGVFACLLVRGPLRPLVAELNWLL